MIGTYYVTGLNNGQQYSVQVRAVNAQGPGAWSDTKAVTPTDGSVSGSVPSAFAAGQWSVLDTQAGGTAAVTVSALPSASPSITDIQYRLNSGAAVSFGGSATGTYNITGLTDDQQYSVQIRAVNAEGAGNWSDTKSVTPTTAAGGAFEDFTTWAVSGVDSSILTVTSSQVSWAGAQRNSKAYIARDFGVGGLSGKWTFRFEHAITATALWSQFGFLSAADTVTGLSPLSDNWNYNYRWYTTYSARMGYRLNDNLTATDFYYSGAQSAGTNGTVFGTMVVDPASELLTLQIRYNSHEDTPHATATQAWPTAAQAAFRYLIIGTEGRTDSETAACSGFVRNLTITQG
jgi:hypothetical protein